ncbi:uncharacterized protein LOC125654834 [Ostrea edulis]|uniref:uncharacterized protein LOC125654834 n=1 Tax=Ostrea edulis TaxID=37623 RepID=UPI0024AF1FE1|nr:uncharacterized protein LOC125654834 [Ostrea edulis]
MLHPRRSAQHVLLCDLCETVPLQSHCELCNVNLCVNCVGKHLLDSSTGHNVVSHLQRRSTPNYSKCPKHANEHSKLYCEKCNIPVCITRVSSGKHKHHKISDIHENLSAQTQLLQNDLKELENIICPRYEEMAYNVQTEKAEVETNYGELITAADQQGENLHREITAIVNQRKADIGEMKNKHLSTLNKNTKEIAQNITELEQIISDLKSILKANDISLTSTYKSRNSEFRTLPPKVRVTLPSFSTQKINKDKLNKMFGSLQSLSINTEYSDTMKSPEAVSSAPIKSLLDEPQLIATFNTGYKYLHSVSCFGEEVWTRGNSKIMKLLNLQGNQLTSIQTESGNIPEDIAVTRDGDLVYTDRLKKTVNLVKNEHIHNVITLQGWCPLCVCSTSDDDLLVSMISDDKTQTKVARYSDSTETQTIQFDDQGHPLYSSGVYIHKYVSENRNHDICVADREARAVVVVNRSGKLRFKYTGHPSNTKTSFNPFSLLKSAGKSSNTKKPFDPIGITTDSHSHILTVDSNNNRVHILDLDGQFLRYIKNCQLDAPVGLCVDIRDNLFVAEWDAAKVKKIQYYKQG